MPGYGFTVITTLIHTGFSVVSIKITVFTFIRGIYRSCLFLFMAIKSPVR